MNIIDRGNYKSSEHLLGGKATRLFELMDIGINVPEMVVLPSELLKAQCVVGAIEYNSEESFTAYYNRILENEICKKLSAALSSKIDPNKSYAVRSSCNLEDGNQHSFAGIFDTFLNCRDIDEIILSVKKCFASKYTKRVYSYCQRSKIDTSDIEVNVIIQEQVDATFSGVTFTVNPQTGEGKEVIIEAIKGQGEAIVKGQVTPDSYCVNWYGGNFIVRHYNDQTKALFLDKNKGGLVWSTVEPDKRLLSTDKVWELTNKALELGMYFGIPIDIEWCYYEDELHIVQVRPMTQIYFEIDSDWTNADLKDGGISSHITTPFMYSVYKKVFDISLPTYFSSIGVQKNSKNHEWFMHKLGFCYWNIGLVKSGMSELPGFNERNFDKSFGVLPNYEGDGKVVGYGNLKNLLKGLNVLRLTKKSINGRMAKCKELINRSETYFHYFEQFLSKQIEMSMLPEVLKKMESYYLDMECNYFYTIYDNSNAATFCQESIQKYNKKSDVKVDYLNLIIGLHNLSHVRPNITLWDFSRSVMEDEEALAFYNEIDCDSLKGLVMTNKEFPFSNEWKNIIENFKHRSYRELDITAPNWDEYYDQPLSLLKNFLELDDSYNPILIFKRQRERFEKEFSKIKSSSVCRKVEQHRRFLWWREEIRNLSTETYYYIRKCLKHIEEHLLSEKMLTSIDDIFYLSIDELIQLIEVRDYDKANKIIANNKIYRQSFRNYEKPNELFKQISKVEVKTEDVKNIFNGIGGAPGVVQGIVRVIPSIYDANEIQRGEILVTEFTDPGWTSFFTKINGLITETGGILSHGSIVSREYGIPAVMAVYNICDSLKTGDYVEINGVEGTVKILEK